MDKRLEKKLETYNLMRGNLTPEAQQKELVNIEAFKSLLQIERALIREINDTDSPIGQAVQDAVFHFLFFNGVEDLEELAGRLDRLENDLAEVREMALNADSQASSTENNVNHSLEHIDCSIIGMERDIDELRQLIKGKRGR